MNFPFRKIDGVVDYVQHDGVARGREWFSMHRYAGGRVFRACCQMNQEALIRDATWTMDDAWRPLDGHVRVILDSKIIGSTWYAFDGNSVRCEARTSAHGHVSQTQISDRPYEFLGLHPLLADGLLGAARGRTDPGRERFIRSITCSYSQNGETELLALPIDIGVAYLGDEQLSVPAGTFMASRYAVRWRPEWAPADYWVFGDDYVFLKSDWAVSSLTCELVSLVSSDEG
ncbi:MAG: hypothetical protein KDE14_16060, partial [Rhodobacteraceae bacterium]|nr:hypothetical protein [Paracoccaceae bacterium]